jgi:hypothetical protein
VPIRFPQFLFLPMPNRLALSKHFDSTHARHSSQFYFITHHTRVYPTTPTSCLYTRALLPLLRFHYSTYMRCVFNLQPIILRTRIDSMDTRIDSSLTFRSFTLIFSFLFFFFSFSDRCAVYYTFTSVIYML